MPAPVVAASGYPGVATAIVGAGILSAHAEPANSAQLGCRAQLERQFPHVPWIWATAPAAGGVIIEEQAWRDPGSDLYRWDALILALQGKPGWLLLVPHGGLGQGLAPAMRALLQILTRYQRLAPRLNADSRGEPFASALALHRSLHDLRKPLVRADHEHALDVWQWVLRLEPRAGLALQLAALFHDIERLSSEADQRIEQHASDYQAFKDAHAEVGARLAVVTARAAGVDASECARMQELIQEHERPVGERGVQAELLGDADALSFFSLNSRGFIDHYGAEHTRRKVRYTLGRMSARALGYLSQMKLPPQVRRFVLESDESLWVRRPEETA
ncbi:MAG TPA: DUF4202 family protein [Polyangiaceae bacterium]|nr:DUF4202 family protein [Polyangiaceae bacterium]